jgi:AraC-like DNA-binding protein
MCLFVEVYLVVTISLTPDSSETYTRKEETFKHVTSKQRVNLARLAKVSGISRATVYRYLKEALGCSFPVTINSLRQVVKDPHYSVEDLFFEVLAIKRWCSYKYLLTDGLFNIRSYRTMRKLSYLKKVMAATEKRIEKAYGLQAVDPLWSAPISGASINDEEE